MNVYPYKQIKAGRYTKWSVSLASNGGVVIEQAFRGKRLKQLFFSTKKEVESSDIPKHVKTVALLALRETKSLGIGE
jgi:hypothetical protein